MIEHFKTAMLRYPSIYQMTPQGMCSIGISIMIIIDYIFSSNYIDENRDYFDDNRIIDHYEKR